METVEQKYQRLITVYEAINPKEEIFEQRPFFERLIQQHRIKRCLDCACGTGWHLSMLHDLGIECYGSDISQDMLNEAQQNLSDSSILLKREDFRTLSKSWEHKFDMVICMSTSLPHMLTDDDVTDALNSMHAVLNPEGILVIANGISDTLLDAQPRLIPARIGEDQAVYFFLEYPTPDEIVFNILHIKKTANSFDHVYVDITYNAMRKSVLERCFARTHFQRIEYFGDYSFSGYSTNTSQRLIVIAHK